MLFNLKTLILPALVFFSLEAWAENYELSLKAQAQVEGKNILLADLIDENNTSAEFIQKYGQLDMDSQEFSQEIKPSQVLIFLARSGFDLSQVKLVSPASRPVLISHDINLINPIREGILFFANNKSKDKKFYDAIVDEEKIKKFRFGPQDEVRVEGMTGDWVYPLFQVVSKNSESGQESRFNVKATLIEGIPVVVSKKSFFPGDLISRDDVEVINRKDNQNPDEISDLSFLLSSEKTVVKQMIEKGQPILKSSILAQTVVQKGSLVSLVSGDGHFQVRVMGKVKEVIDNGQSVLVENIDSKKEILGKPISANEVKVFY